MSTQDTTMENRQNFSSILPFLPLKQESSSSSSSLVWPTQVNETLKSLSKGPIHSRVNSGEVLFDTISDLRDSLSLPRKHIASSASKGYKFFFDEILSRVESSKWFEEIIPKMANLLLQLPNLLESHYQFADIILIGIDTSLRLLEPQNPGIVFLSQELIAALLSCSFFCLFPISERRFKDLPITINFDQLFAKNYECHGQENMKNKIKCVIHYFERICSCKQPLGYVSFERRVLFQNPNCDLWANSQVTLCQFRVFDSGLIEDHSEGGGDVEVDFANRYLGGGVLHKGCVQEEIRFVINPELIIGMLFLPSMSDNEAIEIVGVERFSNYTGYSSTFRYSGDHVDTREIDSLGRRKTRVVAIDALPRVGTRQYNLDCLLREINKAFCGFINESKYQNNSEVFGDGIVTGNWGCGAFGGDPQVKAMLQWLAASQASRPSISYYTFKLDKLENLDKVCEWIMSQKWNVGDLWNMLVDYSSKRAKGETKLDFFTWLLPSFNK